MTYIQKLTKQVEWLPCVICGKKEDVHEYMLKDKYSFFYCDTCKIGAEAGKSSEISAHNWDMLMRSNTVSTNDYFKELEGHADIEDWWWKL